MLNDLEIVLLEWVLEYFAAFLDAHGVHALGILVVEGAPLLLVLEQLVAMSLQGLGHCFAVQTAGALYGIPPLPDDAVGGSRRA